MGRFREQGADDGGEVGIDMSPLIDCVFILLIFFIVTTVFVEETGVEVNKREAASASSLEKTSILIAITAKDEVVYAGQDIGVRGVQGKVKQAIQSDPDIPVIIQADKHSNSGILVRVIDEAKLGGAKKVSVATAAQRG
ncbi:MAG: biopolymer transporter ExbD [Planctomycetota bacterium]